MHELDGGRGESSDDPFGALAALTSFLIFWLVCGSHGQLSISVKIYVRVQRHHLEFLTR